MTTSIEKWLGIVFGLIFMGLSIFVTVEVIMRKVFGASLQGADELGGYALAIGATLSFCMALVARTHIRIDIFHGVFPRWLVVSSNLLSSVGLAAFAGLLAYAAWFVVADTVSYKSVAPTPWATPLVYPQSVWLAGLVAFALMAAALAARSSMLALRGRRGELNKEFGPRSTHDEVGEELRDLEERLHAATLPVSQARFDGAKP